MIDFCAVSKRRKGVPSVVALLLADHVYSEPNGKHVIAGTFAAMYAPGFPTIHPSSTLFLELTGFSGEHSLDVRLYRLRDGHELGKSPPRRIKHDDRALHLQIIISLPPLRFEEPGPYALELFWNNEYLARRKFDVIEGEPR